MMSEGYEVSRKNGNPGLKHIATSRYNALTFKVQKRYSNGLSLLASYAYSHSIDLNSEFGGTSPQNNACIRCDLASSGFDERHVANISYIYVVPALSNRSSFLKYTLGGWQLSGITTLESGRPFTINLNFDNANVGSRGNFQRPNLVGNPFPSGFASTYGPGGSYFNTLAFQAAPQYQFGNLGRNAVRDRPYYNTDIGAFKNLHFTERYQLQFRAEFFNIFNNVNFDMIDHGDHTYGDPTFGQVTGTVGDQRIIQFGLKLLF
jgi:hypothetical protein